MADLGRREMLQECGLGQGQFLTGEKSQAVYTLLPHNCISSCPLPGRETAQLRLQRGRLGATGEGRICLGYNIYKPPEKAKNQQKQASEATSFLSQAFFLQF